MNLVCKGDRNPGLDNRHHIVVAVGRQGMIARRAVDRMMAVDCRLVVDRMLTAVRSLGKGSHPVGHILDCSPDRGGSRMVLTF